MALAPLFEVAHVDDRGQVVHYEGKHLTPANALQGDVPPGPKLFERRLNDGRDLVGLVLAAVDQLAQVVNSVGALPPPQVLWLVLSTGEAYCDRQEAGVAARAATQG